jgi:hypothetical protein
MPEIPKDGTPEYRWWLAGAMAEADACKEGRSPAGLAVLEVVDALAQARPFLSEAEIAAFTFEIFAASLPLRQRIRLAWKAIRR